MMKPQSKIALRQFEETEKVLCFFCGGSKCKYQNFKNNNILPNAIQGLHSNWITQNIVAMQRPSTRLIRQYSIIKQLKEQIYNNRNNIISILNLEQPGQHSSCGDGIEKGSGFSYHPQQFYSSIKRLLDNIFFYNYSWPDMKAPDLTFMMKILVVFFSTFNRKGKIAVHCHAGKGRTMLAICSWIIFNDRISAKQTIKRVQSKRSGVLTQRVQRKFLRRFQQCKSQQLEVNKIRLTFNNTFFTFDQLITKQNLITFGEAKKKTKYIPLIQYFVFHRLRNMEKQYSKKDICMAFINPNDINFQEKFNQQQLKQLIVIFYYQNDINKGLYSNILKIKDPRILSECLLQFYQQSKHTIINELQVQIFNKIIKQDILAQILKKYEISVNFNSKIISILLDLCMFASQICKQQDQLLQKFLHRFIFALTKKKQFSKSCFQGRTYLYNKISINDNEFIKSLTRIINQIQNFSQQEFEQLIYLFYANSVNFRHKAKQYIKKKNHYLGSKDISYIIQDIQNKNISKLQYD